MIVDGIELTESERLKFHAEMETEESRSPQQRAMEKPVCYYEDRGILEIGKSTRVILKPTISATLKAELFFGLGCHQRHVLVTSLVVKIFGVEGGEGFETENTRYLPFPEYLPLKT